MRRKTRKHTSITTPDVQNSPQFDVATEIQSLKRELARLRTQIAKLSATQHSDFDDELEPPRSSPPRPRRGRKPRHSPGLQTDRDMLVRLFEENWPEMEPLCRFPPKMRALAKLFRRLADADPNGQLGGQAQRMLDNLEWVEKFLVSPTLQRRCRGDPRVLAGALAGVPNIGLWRSLKLCPPKSCKVDRNLKAMPAYLRRNHPQLARTLDAGTDLVQLIDWMKEYRTRDQIVRRLSAADILRLWNQ